MSFLGLFDSAEDRFLKELRRISQNHEYLGALAIGGHGYLGQLVDDQLLKPLVSFLATSKAASTLTGWKSQRPSDNVLRAMRCEGVLSVIACSFEIDETLATRTPHQFLWQLPRLTNGLAMVERRYAWAQVPQVSEPSTSYSDDVEESFAQLAVQWASLLRLKDANFRRMLYDLGLQSEWSRLQIALRGLVTGAERNPPDSVIKKARQLLRVMEPPYRSDVTSTILNGLRAMVALPQRPLPLRTAAAQTPQGFSVPLYNARGKQSGFVRFGPDDKANISTTKDADFVSAIMIPAITFAQDLGAEERVQFSRWVGLSSGRWTPAHSELFAIVFLHMIRDGSLTSQAFVEARSYLRAATLPPIPRPLTPEMQALYQQLFSHQTTENPGLSNDLVHRAGGSPAHASRVQYLKGAAEEFGKWLHDSHLDYFILADIAQGVPSHSIRSALTTGGIPEEVATAYLEMIRSDYRKMTESERRSLADSGASLINTIERGMSAGVSQEQLLRLLITALGVDNTQARAVLLYISSVERRR